MIDSGKETAEFSLDDKHGLRKMARALSSETRLTILETLQSGSRSIGELSEELQIPMSTVSTSVSILEESGLIIAKNKSQERGMLKLCSPSVSQVIFNLNNIGSVETDETPVSSERWTRMPIFRTCMITLPAWMKISRRTVSYMKTGSPSANNVICCRKACAGPAAVLWSCGP